MCPSPSPPAWALLLALSGLCLAPACSKGGLPDGSNPQGCRRISDPEPDSQETPLPKELYAELRSADLSVTLPIKLTNGFGGAYDGMTERALQKCDPPGNYFIDRLALVDAAGNPVATAARSGSSYVVRYQRGGQTVVSTSGFTGRHYTTYSAGSAAGPSLAALGGGGTVLQGERVGINVNAAAMDDCGMRDVTLWLTPSSSPGVMTSPPASVVLPGGEGTASLRIPPELAATTYVVEGRLRSKTGKYVDVRRMSSTDTTYSIYNPNTGYTSTSIPLVRVTVTDNPNADRIGPQPVSMTANPMRAARCQGVTLSLKVSDDKGLPASQEVKLRIGPLGQPALLRTPLTGGDTLSGTFTVPLDAPGGIWIAYPESVADSAGNVSTGTLSGDKFTLHHAGVGTPQPVQAATFIVEEPGAPQDLGAATPDMAMPVADMALELPATLVNIDVTPTSVMPDQTVRVTVTWMGTGLK